MNTFFDTASRTLTLLSIALSGAACLSQDPGDAGEEAAEISEDLSAALPVPVAEAPCIPGLPPIYPGCYPFPTSGPWPLPCAPAHCGVGQCGGFACGR